MAPDAPRKRFRVKKLTPVRRAILLAMFLIPLGLIVLKHAPLPFSHALRDVVSLAGTAREVEGRVANVLLVPLGAALVVFLRVALGIRVLGPFRAALLAIAFQVTGIPLGLFFLGLVIAAIVLVRPIIKRRLRLPYYSRLSVSLSTVAALIAITLVVGRAFHVEKLTRTAYFPIVVLCLTADGFASALRREGMRSALWRGAMTAGAAVLITELTHIRGFSHTLVRYPELILAEIGFTMVISYFLGFRLLAFLNPPLPRKRKRSRKTKAAKVEERPALGLVPSQLLDPAPQTTSRRTEG